MHAADKRTLRRLRRRTIDRSLDFRAQQRPSTKALLANSAIQTIIDRYVKI